MKGSDAKGWGVKREDPVAVQVSSDGGWSGVVMGWRGREELERDLTSDWFD